MPEKQKQRLLYLASKNPHKLSELKEILKETEFDVRLCSELDAAIEWEEIGATFADNAMIKALAVRKYTGAAVLADDSGLEVLALNNAPGVFSSRYGGKDGDDAANNKKLLNSMHGVSDRQARFVCCLVFLEENGRKSVFHGFCSGIIIDKEKGQQGFGYDPLFFLPSHAKTLAELSSKQKNAISHRGNALKQFRTFLEIKRG